MIEVVCVFLGSVLAIGSSFIINTYENKAKECQNAKMLYFDLNSIVSYFSSVYDWSAIGNYPDIRYNDRWQDMVLSLGFLQTEEIDILYRLYDKVYDYNQVFRQTKDIVKLEEYRSATREVVYSNEFKVVMNVIRDKTKIPKR